MATEELEALNPIHYPPRFNLNPNPNPNLMSTSRFNPSLNPDPIPLLSVTPLPPFSRCTVPRLKRSVVGCLPVLYWLPRYSIWDYGMPDLISGISVGIMHLPQGMAYALLASLPPVFGLYTSLYPALVYFFFGTSRHISIGTFAVLSIMVGSVTERLAPDRNFLVMLNGTNLTEVNITARDSYRVQVAAATTVLGGLIQVVLGLVKFGFVGTYLSEPLVRAYTTAAAAHAVVAVIAQLFGLSTTRFSGPLSLVYTLVEVCSKLPQTHLPTLAVSGVSMVFLIAAKEINSAISARLPVPIPVELITIVAATVISSYTHLNGNYTISVVGEIPSGLAAPRLPDASLFKEVMGDAFALAIVGYAISISLGKTFALKHGYKVDSNQELVALGLSNAVGGFFQCYAVCSSMSRSLIQESTGGKTQMAGMASAVIVLVTVLKLGPLFQELPKAVLAAIVFVNLKGMFKQYYDIITLWRSSKVDLVVWLVTWVSTLLFNLDMGLGASITFAVLTVIFRTHQWVTITLSFVCLCVWQVREVPGITIFHSSATVYFANADLYLEALKGKQKTGVFSVEEAAGQWKEPGGGDGDREESLGDDQRGWCGRENGTVFVMPTTPRTPDDQCSWEYLKGSKDPDCATLGAVSELQDGDTTTLGSSSEDTLSRELDKVSLGSLGKWTWDIHSIILDLSTANFIDTVAIKTMRNIFHDFGEIDVTVYMAGCQMSVVEQLELGGFFSESITKGRLFATVHDAVLHCLGHQGTSMPSYEYSLVRDVHVYSSIVDTIWKTVYCFEQMNHVCKYVIAGDAVQHQTLRTLTEV
uniref:Solute carrier family 26 member 6, like 1 n=1 Tax=Oncorhynchus mykiss TaxID=8022 RepID=A0A8C7V6V9_ONCMY